MDKRYVFFFSAQDSIHWSGESAEYIRDTRFKNASEGAKQELAEFFDSCESGDFITLPSWDGCNGDVAVICERS